MCTVGGAAAIVGNVTVKGLGLRGVDSATGPAQLWAGDKVLEFFERSTEWASLPPGPVMLGKVGAPWCLEQALAGALCAVFITLSQEAPTSTRRGLEAPGQQKGFKLECWAAGENEPAA